MTAKEYLNQAYWLAQHLHNKVNMGILLCVVTPKTTGIMSGDVQAVPGR